MVSRTGYETATINFFWYSFNRKEVLHLDQAPWNSVGCCMQFIFHYMPQWDQEMDPFWWHKNIQLGWDPILLKLFNSPIWCKLLLNGLYLVVLQKVHCIYQSTRANSSPRSLSLSHYPSLSAIALHNFSRRLAMSTQSWLNGVFIGFSMCRSTLGNVVVEFLNSSFFLSSLLDGK